MKDIAVTYLGGSGFLVALGDVGLLFDASEHGQDLRVMPERETLAALKKLYVFVSHRHDDHFSETIYDLCGDHAVYIVGYEFFHAEKTAYMSLQRGQWQNDKCAFLRL